MLLGLPLPVRHQPLKGDFGGIRNTADYLGSFDSASCSGTVVVAVPRYLCNSEASVNIGRHPIEIVEGIRPSKSALEKENTFDLTLTSPNNFRLPASAKAATVNLNSTFQPDS